jgi:glycosyltransferase involved in cell wall biosynthesis
MKVLLIAYTIMANRGSEPGVGYQLVSRIARRFADVTLITQAENIPALQEDPDFTHVKLVAVDLPKQWMRLKKDDRGMLIYYFLWQFMVGRTIRKMENFDIIHQVTLSAAWTPHFIFSKTAKIFIGPILNHEKIPHDFWFDSPRKFLTQEILIRVLKVYFFHVDPFLRWAIRRTHRIFVGCPSIPPPYREDMKKIVMLKNGASNFPVWEKDGLPKNFHVLFVGRMIDLKGCVPALEAFGEFYRHLPPGHQPRVHMDFIGSGPLEPILNRMIVSKNLPVTLHTWKDQEELPEFYRRAAVFLFPSFEAQGMVVVEALAHGCPVICLGNTGPSFLAGEAGLLVSKDNYDYTVMELSKKLEILFDEYMMRPDIYRERTHRAARRADSLSWESKVERVIEAYGE